MLEKSYTNPIIPCTEKRNTSDPFVARYKGAYYHCFANTEGVFITKSDTLWGIGNYPAVKVYDSMQAGALQEWYAPELHFIDGTWYIYGSPDYGGGVHVMSVLACEGEDPMGRYELKGQMSGLENTWSIDGTPFFFKGKWWFSWSNCGCVYLAKLNSPTSIGSEWLVLTRPEYDFEKQGSPVNEGSAPIVRDEKLFMVYSASDSKVDGYCLGLLEFLGDSAEDMLKEEKWLKSDKPVFERTNEAFGPGHCSFVKVENEGVEEDYIVYHANVESGTGWDGRSVWVQKFTFDERGKPVFGKPQKTCKI
jgi:GH43 family beta-xylosidase